MHSAKQNWARLVSVGARRMVERTGRPSKIALAIESRDFASTGVGGRILRLVLAIPAYAQGRSNPNPNPGARLAQSKTSTNMPLHGTRSGRGDKYRRAVTTYVLVLLSTRTVQPMMHDALCVVRSIRRSRSECGSVNCASI